MNLQLTDFDIVAEARRVVNGGLATVGRQDFGCVVIQVSGKMTRVAGIAHYGLGVIRLSRWFFSQLENLPQLRETVLHELAHLLVGPGKGHGPKFREMARRLGTDPERTHKMSIKSGPVICSGCHQRFLVPIRTWGKIKRGRKRYIHKVCKGLLSHEA